MLTSSEYAAKHPDSPKRKSPKMPKPFSGAVSKQAMRVYDEKKARYQAYVEAYDGVKEAIIASLGPDIRKAIEHPEEGFERITIGYICAWVERNHGQVTDEDLAKVNRELEAVWDPSTPLTTFVANMTQRFAFLEAAGHAKSEHDKLVYLDRALATDPSAAEAVRVTKVQAARSQLDRTYAETAAEVIRVTPAMRPTTASAFLGHVNRSAAASGPQHIMIPSTGNAAVDAFISDHLAKHSAAFAGASVTIASQGSTSRPPDATPPRNGASLYCFEHGWNFTHAGADCQVLKQEPDAAVRQAKMAAKNPRSKVAARYGCARVARRPPRVGGRHGRDQSGSQQKNPSSAAAVTTQEHEEY
jgi:hypothetical protein